MVSLAESCSAFFDRCAARKSIVFGSVVFFIIALAGEMFWVSLITTYSGKPPALPHLSIFYVPDVARELLSDITQSGMLWYSVLLLWSLFPSVLSTTLLLGSLLALGVWFARLQTSSLRHVSGLAVICLLMNALGLLGWVYVITVSPNFSETLVETVQAFTTGKFVGYVLSLLSLLLLLVLGVVRRVSGLFARSKRD